MKLDLSKQAMSFVSTLDPKRFRQVMKSVLSLLEEPYPHDAARLKSFDDLYRVHCGEYRIIYGVVGDTVEVLMIGKRNDDEVYRELRRRLQ